jgi:hypothetical protein
MAGNTKLIGFGSGKVFLERWGERTEVELPSSSVASLVGACREQLPSAPNRQPRSGSTSLSYDGHFGVIRAFISPQDCESIGKLLELVANHHEPTDSQYETAKAWAEELLGLAQEHKDYLNTDNEPGVS